MKSIRLILPVAAAFCLSACANEDVRAGRARSAELQKQFTSKAAAAKHYAEVRREVETLRAELATAPEKPLLPSVPPPPTKEEFDDAAAAEFPLPPPQRPAILGPYELRQLDNHHDDAEDEIAKIDTVLESLQALTKVKRKLDAARIALSAERSAAAEQESRKAEEELAKAAAAQAAHKATSRGGRRARK